VGLDPVIVMVSALRVPPGDRRPAQIPAPARPWCPQFIRFILVLSTRGGMRIIFLDGSLETSRNAGHILREFQAISNRVANCGYTRASFSFTGP
jgi:hypothetical protein